MNLCLFLWAICAIPISFSKYALNGFSSSRERTSAGNVLANFTNIKPEFYFILDFTPCANIYQNKSDDLRKRAIRAPTATVLPPVDLRIPTSFLRKPDSGELFFIPYIRLLLLRAQLIPIIVSNHICKQNP